MARKFPATKDLFHVFITGLLHLTTNCESIIHLSHHLLKSSTKLDVERPGTAGYLGTVLAFSLQTVCSLDQISRCVEAAADSSDKTTHDDIHEELVLQFRYLLLLLFYNYSFFRQSCMKARSKYCMSLASLNGAFYVYMYYMYINFFLQMKIGK